MGYEEIEEDTQKVTKKEEKKDTGKKDKAEKVISVSDILTNHEQRIIQMEAKWFRLGGI